MRSRFDPHITDILAWRSQGLTWKMIAAKLDVEIKRKERRKTPLSPEEVWRYIKRAERRAAKILQETASLRALAASSPSPPPTANQELEHTTTPLKKILHTQDLERTAKKTPTDFASIKKKAKEQIQKPRERWNLPTDLKIIIPDNLRP